MIAGRVKQADGMEAIRAALVSVFESFTLRPLWTKGGPEWVHLDLSLGDYALIPTVRPEAIERIATTVGDMDVEYQVPRRVPLVKAVSGSSEGLPT
ncbi:MAG: hypothetical protein ACRDMU_02890 [Gaiellaceae bacterium]